MAIEVTVAHADLFSPAALLDRLHRRLPLPVRQVEDAPARHHSLEAAIGWSYRQLGPSGQALLRRLACVPGSRTLEVAKPIAGGESRVDVLAAVLELVDKGLVIAFTNDNEAHFVVLQTVRAYVAHLHSSPDEAGAMVHFRHRWWADHHVVTTAAPGKAGASGRPNSQRGGRQCRRERLNNSVRIRPDVLLAATIPADRRPSDAAPWW
jgi:predicted ATPase